MDALPMQEYTPRPGDHIETAAAEMVALADTSGAPVRAEFNGVTLTANPGVSAAEIVAFFHSEMDSRQRNWKASPEGIESARRVAEGQAQASAAAAEGLKPFAIRDPDAWAAWVDANPDPYGACTVRYAARWANLMESKMAAGATLADVAKDASHEADAEGITGFMYGCAVAMLARVWEHGEELRRWHNLTTQLGDEGERANESAGAVLNPAVLTIGGS